MAPPVPLDDDLPGSPWVSSSQRPAHPGAPLGGGGWGCFGVPLALGGRGNDATLAPHPWSPVGRRYRLDWQVIRDIQQAGVAVQQDSLSAQAEQDNGKPLAELSAIRQQAVKLCREVLPAPYLSQKYKANPFHVTKEHPQAQGGYSTCGEFPAYIVWLLQGKPIPGRFGPGTKALQPQGEKRGAWRMPNGIDWPRPGDLYALCSSTVVDGSCDHVGVMLDSTGTVWTTGDWGQPDSEGRGFAGAIVSRAFDPERGTLSGDPVIGNNPRAIKGWIDLDAYFAK
jgi:hypothetical protein